MTEWTDDIEMILGKLRENCIILYKYHLERYYSYKKTLPFFKIPVLILSAFNSVFSVGLQPYLKQSNISILICIVSLFITIMNSVEMYMGIQKSLETEMSASQGFYLLSIDIYKMLALKRDNRDVSGKQYLTDCYNLYQELIKQSKLIHDPTLRDTLQILYDSPIPLSIIPTNVSTLQSPSTIYPNHTLLFRNLTVPVTNTEILPVNTPVPVTNTELVPLGSHDELQDTLHNNISGSIHTNADNHV
jgi:hypothetical protein